MKEIKNNNIHSKIPRIIYKTNRGIIYNCFAEDILMSDFGKRYYGKVQLIFTSPPFSLNRKKKYGNLQGEEYIKWFTSFAPLFRKLLKKDGSIVIELGNSWEPGKPVMSSIAMKALLSFLEEGQFFLCQQFVCYNPAKLPTPAQWVNVERIRVKDAFTHIWWMSPTAKPKADNRNILVEYSESMKKLLSTGKYNPGKRPSEHNIGTTSFLKDNKGAIPSNVLIFSNTSSNDDYQKYCRANNFVPHPARMHIKIAEFFINFLTKPKDLVFDPFAGSNTTGASAERLKRRWIAIEPNELYIKTSIGRFQDICLT